MRHKPIWDYETGAPRSQGKMTPIDYWYKKYYIALKECERIPKPELTWEDVKAIVNIANSMLTYTAWDEINYPDEREYYEKVLQRFNEAKEGEK